MSAPAKPRPALRPYLAAARGFAAGTSNPREFLEGCLAEMAEWGAGCAHITTRANLQIREFRPRDIVRVLGDRGAAVIDAPVSAVMTRKVVSCRQTDTVAAIMEMMTLGKFRHLPVVEGERVVGLISIGDVVKWRVQEYENEQEALRQYIKTA